ncbi:MAG: pyridoxamine 5'-phosphate oxidase family protein [Chloroflexi bacterium]|nr:pyridoxamine 5'-phosphate oxidase family protein [Chloroflexota bacterium]
MSSWSEVAAASPELARIVQERFDAHGLGLLATLRRDGSPRISGIEPLFALNDLWLGMMPGSRKALDLLRDGRFALHSATTDKQVTQGDARVAGVALAVEGEAEFARFRKAFAAHAGYPPPEGPFQLIRADIREISLIKPGGDHLDIDWWRADEATTTRHVDRR